MFDWGAYLDLAERLAGEVDDEAALRGGISRAYYAAYHAAADFVRVSGLLPTGHSHLRVWDVLVTSPDPERRDVGERGTALKRLRTDADYRSVFPGDLGRVAGLSVVRARTLIALIQRLD